MMNVLKKSKLKSICVVLLFVFTIGKTMGQCPQLQMALINSCAAGAGEGANEYVVFTTTGSAAVSTYTFYYGSGNPPTTLGAGYGILAGATAGPKTGTGTFITTNGCTFTEVTSPTTVIPAGATVIFVPAEFDYSPHYDVTSLCSGGNLYIVYITNSSPSHWQDGGTMANTPSGNRYLQITTTASDCAAGIRTYTQSWPGGDADGNIVSWDASGNPTYYNNGCTTVAPPGPTVAPNVVTVCTDNTPVPTTATISYATTGTPNTYSLTWNAAALTAGFTNVPANTPLPASAITINLPSGIANTTGSYTASMIVTNTASGKSSTSTNNVTITFNKKPIVAAITGINPVCKGTTNNQFTDATTGGTWTSSDITVATVGSSTGMVSGVANGPATLTYAVTNTCGTTSVTYPFIVIDKPVVAPITGNTSACVGSTTTFSDVTPGGVWSTTDATVATIDNNGVVTGTGPGAAIVNYAVTNGCGTTTASNIVIVSGATITPITGPNNVCTGATITLGNTTTGGTWSSSNTGIATISSTGVVTGVAQGTVNILYTVAGSGGGCSTGAQSYTITVNGKPPVSPITAAGSATKVCIGATLALSDATTGGTWSSSNTALATISTTGVVTGVAAGTVTIGYKVTGTTCGDSTTTYSVTVNPLPSLTISPTNPVVCGNNSVTLTATSDASTLKWQNEANPGAQTTVSPTTTTTYTVTATSSQGCTNSGTVTVTVQNFIVTLAANPNPVVQGGQLTLTTSASVTPYQVTSWQPTNLFTSQTATTQVITAGATTQYIVTATNGAGCTDTDTLTVTVTPNTDDIYIPNYLSPNNDGKNDVFKVQGSNIKSLELRVYNQWGQLIFESSDQNTPWDGTYKGKQQPVGTYVYVAKITLQNGTTINKKGSINLIR